MDLSKEFSMKREHSRIILVWLTEGAFVSIDIEGWMAGLPHKQMHGSISSRQ